MNPPDAVLFLDGDITDAASWRVDRSWSFSFGVGLATLSPAEARSSSVGFEALNPIAYR